MNHRIRSAAIVINNEKKILMVLHCDPQTNQEWWVPPGGGLEQGEDIFINAKRETKEETGIDVELDKVLYIREFVDKEHNNHNIELFILAKSHQGKITLDNLIVEDEDYYFIKDVKWLSHNELKNLNVFPEILKNKFWQDLENNLPFKYLGQQIK